MTLLSIEERSQSRILACVMFWRKVLRTVSALLFCKLAFRLILSNFDMRRSYLTAGINSVEEALAVLKAHKAKSKKKKEKKEKKAKKNTKEKKRRDSSASS